MTRLSGRRFALLLTGLLALVGLGLAKPKARDPVRLRAVDPKPFYKPGDTIVLELRCGPGITDVFVYYNPTQDPADAGMGLPIEKPRCPFSRLEIPIPRDFIGRNQVTVRMPDSDKLSARFQFEVRSDEQPADLWFSTDSQNEGCNSSFLRDMDGEPPRVWLSSVLADGTRFDICREKNAVLAAIPTENAAPGRDDGLCTLSLKKPGPLKVVASYRGLRKEWTCTESRPDTRATPRPRKTMSVEEFLADPARLDRHPAQVGRCRTVEHWDTGNCYVYVEGRGKVSVHTDDRCENLQGLRDRMMRAIQDGLCGSRPPAPKP